MIDNKLQQKKELNSARSSHFRAAQMYKGDHQEAFLLLEKTAYQWNKIDRVQQMTIHSMLNISPNSCRLPFGFPPWAHGDLFVSLISRFFYILKRKSMSKKSFSVETGHGMLIMILMQRAGHFGLSTLLTEGILPTEKRILGVALPHPTQFVAI